MTYIILALLVLAYFLPSVNASNRGHRDVRAIFITNLFLGWTGLGWVLALIWSFTGNVVERLPSRPPVRGPWGRLLRRER